MTNQKKVLKWYDWEAPTYDKSRLDSREKQKQHSIECELVYNLNHSSKRVLELGCGTGRYLQYLKKRGIEVIGVDISKKMLLEAIGVCRIRASVYHLPFKKGSFDSVYLIRAFKFMKPHETLKEIYRVLLDSGSLLLLIASIECAYCCYMLNLGKYNRILHNRRLLHILFSIFGYSKSISWLESGSKLHAQTYSRLFFEEIFSKIEFSKPKFLNLFAYYRLVVLAKKHMRDKK